MYIIVVNSSVRVELAVEAKSVVDTATILESAASVENFYIQGLDYHDQQKLFDCAGFKKWTCPQYNYDGSVK